jgi:hypothetical protein
LGDLGRRRPAQATLRGPGQPGLNSETLSQKTKIIIMIIITYKMNGDYPNISMSILRYGKRTRGNSLEISI